MNQAPRPDALSGACARQCRRLVRIATRFQFQHGQSMIEYVVVCAAVALVLGIGMIDSDSILWQLIDAFQRAYRKFSYAISLPT